MVRHTPTYSGNTMKFSVLLFLALSACAPTVVTGFNGDSIRVQTQSDKVTREALAEAVRICATQGLQAEYASTRYNRQTLVSSHLFLCLSRVKPHNNLPALAGGGSSHGYLESTATL